VHRYQHVLFLCVANSARSQMAEGWARRLFRDAFGDEVRVSSAGSQPKGVNPFAIQAMNEVGIDIASHTSDLVDNADLDTVDLVVTLCAEEVCPVVLRDVVKLHWPLIDPDPKDDTVDDDEVLRRFRTARDAIHGRLRTLVALRDAPAGLTPSEFHASIRVPDLAEAARFYSWLLGEAPKTWTHRYVTFVSERLRTNFVLLVDDGKELHQDTLYHLGVDVGSKHAVVQAHLRAEEAGFHVHKPARTTWRGTPLHELWLKDPGGNLVEVYARLTDDEHAQMPADQEPWVLVAPQGER